MSCEHSARPMYSTSDRTTPFSRPYFEILSQSLALFHPFVLVLEKRINELKSLLEIEIVDALLLFRSSSFLLCGILHLHLMEATVMLHFLRHTVIVFDRREDGDLLQSLERGISFADVCTQFFDLLSKFLDNAFRLF